MIRGQRYGGGRQGDFSVVDPGEMVPEGTAIDFVVSSGIVEPTTKTFTITIPSRYNDEGTVVLAIYKSEYVDGERVLTSRYSHAGSVVTWFQ